MILKCIFLTMLKLHFCLFYHVVPIKTKIQQNFRVFIKIDFNSILDVNWIVFFSAGAILVHRNQA